MEKNTQLESMAEAVSNSSLKNADELASQLLKYAERPIPKDIMDAALLDISSSDLSNVEIENVFIRFNYLLDSHVNHLKSVGRRGNLPAAYVQGQIASVAYARAFLNLAISNKDVSKINL